MTAWNKQAEFCGRYLKKGARILVEGRIENDNYEDKNGVKHYTVDIRVDNIEFAGGKPRQNDNDSGNNNGGDNYENTSDSNSGYDTTDDVDVPF